MANDQLHRAKPHNNAAVILELQRRGLSYIGAHQVVTGQIVTNPNDRRLVSVMAERYVESKDLKALEILSFEIGAQD